jgi:hypothetical protein
MVLLDFDAATKLPYGSMAWVHRRVLGHNLIHRICVKVVAQKFSMYVFS